MLAQKMEREREDAREEVAFTSKGRIEGEVDSMRV